MVITSTNWIGKNAVLFNIIGWGPRAPYPNIIAASFPGREGQRCSPDGGRKGQGGGRTTSVVGMLLSWTLACSFLRHVLALLVGRRAVYRILEVLQRYTRDGLTSTISRHVS